MPTDGVIRCDCGRVVSIEGGYCARCWEESGHGQIAHQDPAVRAAERIYDEWGAVGLGLAAVPSPSTISAIIREAYAPLLDELRAENARSVVTNAKMAQAIAALDSEIERLRHIINLEGGEVMLPERRTLVGGQSILCHPAGDCGEDHCCIHRPSAHHMVSWPQNWRSDRRLMERICPHGVGHPDPDDTSEDRVHGCDGCCSMPASERLRDAVELSELAMNDWLHEYTPEHCNVDDVARTRSRIEHHGGTLGYITDVLEQLRAALAATEKKEAS